MKLRIIAGMFLALAAAAAAQQVQLPGEENGAPGGSQSAPSEIIPLLLDLEEASAVQAAVPAEAEVKPVKKKKAAKPAVVKNPSAVSAAPVKPAAPKTGVKPEAGKIGPAPAVSGSPAPLLPSTIKPAVKSAAAPVPAKPAGDKSPAAKKDAGPAALKPESSRITPVTIVIQPAENKPAPVKTGPAAPPAFSPGAAQSVGVKAVPPAAKAEAAQEAVKPALAVSPAAAKRIVQAVPEAEKEPVPAGTKGGFAVTKSHSVSGGETLWDLSAYYYGDPFKWGKIYNANMEKLSNPDLIYPKDEIEIPGITETVKPFALPAPEAEAQEAAAPAPLPVPEEMAELPVEEADTAVVMPAKEVPSPSAVKVKTRGFEHTDLSMVMPEDQKEWAAGAITIVPENWREDGIIISRINEGADDRNDSLAASGDRVSIKVRNPGSFRPGETISAYMKGAVTYDKKTNKKLGLELQRTGDLEVLGVDNNIVKARVLESNTSVDSGQVIKI